MKGELTLCSFSRGQERPRLPFLFYSLCMGLYRTVLNGTFMLVTTVTKNREPFFTETTCAREAVETLYRVQKLHPFFLYGFVVMPDHCHFLMFVPQSETISRIMNVYKSGLTFNTGIPKIWQKRFHIKTVRNLRSVLRYIHGNPVKAGLVTRPEDYPWSSAHERWKVTVLP